MNAKLVNRKVLVLKTADKDMITYGENNLGYKGFRWPKSGKVICSNWSSKPKNEDGFHGLLWGEGYYEYLKLEDETRKWMVLEIDKDKIINLHGKVKFPECEVIYCGNKNGACKVILEKNPEAACPGAEIEFSFTDKNGSKHYYFNGKLYKTKYFTGSTYWYKNNTLHRQDGPAIEYFDGEKQWFNAGKLHRKNGPARCSNGNEYWYQEGKLHRLDGPAIEWANGDKEYWVEGKNKERFE